MVRVWTCQRVKAGKKCSHVNPRRLQICTACGKRRPKTKKPAHMAALKLTYEQYIKLNGGERCGICGAPPKSARRLNRDHEHIGNGRPRGLLCAKCNRFLVQTRYGLVVTSEWLRAAADYLDRAESLNE